MDIRPIRNDNDHRDALKEIDRLCGTADGTPDGDKLDVLITLVDAYEDSRRPVPLSSPLDILRYAVTDMGHSRHDLARLVGSPECASDLLGGLRSLTIDHVRTISRAWKIPVEALMPVEDVAATT